MSIKQHEILRQDSNVLLGISLGNAVLDILTTESQLRECLKLLQDPNGASRLEETKMGTFGCYSVLLSLDKDGTASIFVDGPYFDPARGQTAGIVLPKEELEGLVLETMEGASTTGKT
jgi:hypothetical protein